MNWCTSLAAGPTPASRHCNNAQLGLNGATIGAGYERQIFPLWGLKVEYRYTKFQSKTIDLPSTSTSGSSAPQTAITSATASGSASYLNTTAHYSPEMQIVSVGISR